MRTGNVHIAIPLITLPQRGNSSVTLTYVYDSSFWRSSGGTDGYNSNPWNPGLDGGGRFEYVGDTAFSLVFDETNLGCANLGTGLQGSHYTYSNFAISYAGGSRISAGDGPSITRAACTRANGKSADDINDGYNKTWTFGAATSQSGDPYADPGPAYFISVTTNTSGLTYKLWRQDGATSLADSNGNMLGNIRPELAQEEFCQNTQSASVLYHKCKITVTTDHGLATYQLRYTAHDVCTSFPHRSAVQGHLNYCAKLDLPDALVLPDNTQYSFTYDDGADPGHYGTLTGIALPTGGHITYQYEARIDYTVPGARLVPTSASDGHGTTDFSFGDFTNSYTYDGPNSTTTVTFPQRYDQTAQILVRDTRQFFTDSSIKDFAAGTTLKRTLSFSKPDTTSVKATLHDEDSGEDTIVTKTYGYGNNVPLYQVNNFDGTIAKTVVTTFLGDNAASAYHSTYHIDNRPLTVSVYNGDVSDSNLLAKTTYSYDEYGASFCDAAGGVLQNASGALGHYDTWNASYFARGNVTTETRSTDSTNSVTTHRCYDTLGNVIATVDTRGNTTKFDYTDVFAASAKCSPSQPLRARASTITDTLQHVSKVTTDSCDLKPAVVSDPNDIAAQRNGTTSKYSNLVNTGRTDAVTTFPDGGQSTETTIIAANSSKITTSLPTTNTTIVRTSTLDDLGREKVKTIGSGSEAFAVQTTYDASGKVTAVSNPYNGLTASPGDTSVYDWAGRLVSVTHPDNTGVTHQYSGSTETITDEVGIQRKLVHDVLANLIDVYEPDSAGALNLHTHYDYDALGRLTHVSQTGAGQETTRGRSFQYDRLGRLTSATNSETGTTTFKYAQQDGTVCAGDVSLPCSKKDARSVVTTYSYDAGNRLLFKQLSGPDATKFYGVSSCFIYDQYSGSTPENAIGRLTAVWTQKGSCPSGASQVPTGALTHTLFAKYDPIGRLKLKKTCARSSCTQDRPQKFDYDYASNPTSYTDGVSSRMFTMSYTSGSRLKTVTEEGTNPANPLVLYQATDFCAFGPARIVLNGSMSMQQTYDSRGRVNSSVVKQGTTPSQIQCP